MRPLSPNTHTEILKEGVGGLAYGLRVGVIFYRGSSVAGVIFYRVLLSPHPYQLPSPSYP